MKEEITKYFIEKSIEDWKSLKEEFQPWGMWIKQYPSISRDIADGIDDSKIMVDRVWFLDKKGVMGKNIWEYKRMITVQFLQPWCKRLCKEPTMWGTTKTHKIGFISFAQYEYSNDYYFDTIYGGLWGRGWKVTFGLETISYCPLWIS